MWGVILLLIYILLYSKINKNSGKTSIGNTLGAGDK
jgi:hypothetical protein